MNIVHRLLRTLTVGGVFVLLTACGSSGSDIEDAQATIDPSGNGAGQFTIDVQPAVSPRSIEATAAVTPNVLIGNATVRNGTAPVAIDVTIDTNGTLTTRNNIANSSDVLADLPLGTTTATWTATDADMNVVTASRTVVVQDRTAPQFTLGGALYTGQDLIYIASDLAQTNVDLGAAQNIMDADPNPTILVQESDQNGNPIGGGFSVSGTAMAPPTAVVPTLNPGTHYFAWTLTDSGMRSRTIILRVVISNTITIVPPQHRLQSQGNAIAAPSIPLNTGFVDRTVTVTSAMLGTASAVGGVPFTAPALPYNITIPSTLPAVVPGAGNNAANANDPANTWTFPVRPVGSPVLVTWRAEDSAANFAAAVQQVEVIDSDAPVLRVPADVSFVSANGSDIPANTVSVGIPTALDNISHAGNISIVVDHHIVSGTTFPGAPTVYAYETTTELVWRATDGSGNFVEASQSVTVTPPAVQCSTLYEGTGNPFETETLPALTMASTCQGCHTAGGGRSRVNTQHDFYLDLADIPANFRKFQEIASYQQGGLPIMGLKPLVGSGVSHGGGKQFADETDPAYVAIMDMVTRSQACVEDTVNTQGVDIGTPYARLRKATLALASRLPTTAEETAVGIATDEPTFDLALDGILDDLMTEDAFYVRLKEIFNDVLLTDIYADRNNDPSNNFDMSNFANGGIFDDSDDATQLAANFGVGRAPLELIANVVRNDRDFREILTANYLMVNPYSATLFDANTPAGFRSDQGNTNMNDWRQVTNLIDNNGRAQPFAGVLSTLAFLSRYPSTNTNRNRHRANKISWYFLGDDIEARDRQPVDFDNIQGPVPTRDEPLCYQCHDPMDPIAGTIKNWNNNGVYGGDRGWYSDNTINNPTPEPDRVGLNSEMVRPGYSFDPANRTVGQLPAAESATALRWLAQQMANDTRFAEKMVNIMFEGLTGYNAATMRLNYPNLASFLTNVQAHFVEGDNAGSTLDDYNLKTVVKDIVKSVYFRAENLAQSQDPAQFADLGMARLVIPEQFDRQIQAVTGGYRWQGPRTNNTLRTEQTYLLMYGGIDSENVVQRQKTINRIMVGIQDRIAGQTACQTVASQLRTSGDLFPYATLTTTPDNNPAVIRQNIQHLHKILLGEVLPSDHPEIEATFQLFQTVRNQLITAGDNGITGACRGGGGATDTVYTVKPWMAVVSYLMSDFNFLYE